MRGLIRHRSANRSANRRSAAGRNERGATVVIVALASIAVFAVGALAVDGGNAWGQRRGLITGTDAAALGAANAYAKGGTGCSSLAATLLHSNNPAASLTECTPSGSSKNGTVTVSAEQDVDYYLAPVLGREEGAVESSTTARWGIPASVSGLRPFGLCADANPAIQNYVRNGVVPAGNIVVTYGKSQPTACGTNVPGNWGLVDFDGGSNSAADTKSWVQDGYPGTVNAGTFAGTCATESTTCYPGDTGAFSNSLNSAMTSLVSSGEAFALPIFDKTSGNGSNSSFHLVAFMFVKLVAYKSTGTAAARSLTLQMTTGIVQGTCCQVGGIDTGARIVTICAVDASNKSGCS